MKRELALFFRSEYKELGLTEDFGAGYEGGRSLWNWSLTGPNEPVQRVVELSIFPSTRIVEVRAKVTPRDFREKYRTNEKIIGTARYQNKPSLVWIRDVLQGAARFALQKELLDIGEEESLPGSYRDVL